MTKNLNFETVGSSMLTMIRVFTGEMWHEVMHSVSRDNHAFYQCVPDPTFQDFLDND